MKKGDYPGAFWNRNLDADEAKSLEGGRHADQNNHQAEGGWGWGGDNLQAYWNDHLGKGGLDWQEGGL